MITLKPISSYPDTTFVELCKLYVEAFPRDERRSVEGLKLTLQTPEMMFYVIESDGVTAGFSIAWKLSGFVYLEHFAVKPSMRGRGIGEQVMKIYADMFGHNIILEVEPDTDNLTHRRIEFYKRCGFDVVSKDYIQPKYEGSGDAMPLWIMASCTPSVVELERWICEVKSKVYGRG
ncbi:MAG: GNAT family N-acetyltransferase [Paludibacteraceae bacterium]|nr:GNAT family N-acetyltransferase [Paludibacteraceae bacterium]